MFARLLPHSIAEITRDGLRFGRFVASGYLSCTILARSRSLTDRQLRFASDLLQ
jgi:hypothetical protein